MAFESGIFVSSILIASVALWNIPSFVYSHSSSIKDSKDKGKIRVTGLVYSLELPSFQNAQRYAKPLLLEGALPSLLPL